MVKGGIEMDALEKLGWEKREDDNKIEYLRNYKIIDREIGVTWEYHTSITITKRNGSIEIYDTDWLINLKQQELLALAEIVKED